VMVHGHAAQPQGLAGSGLAQVDGRAWTDIVGDRRGDGATFVVQQRALNDPNRIAWFHFAIATPTLVWDPPNVGNHTYRTRLTSIGLQGLTQRGGAIEFVHAWDRHHRIFKSEDIAAFGSGIGLSGDFRDRWDRALRGDNQANVFDLPEPRVFVGALGISVGVYASPPLGDQRVTFTQVGARLDYVQES
jgi:hypothetical protein